MIDAQLSRNLGAFDDLVASEEEMFRWQAQKVKLIKEVLLRIGPVGSLADIGCFTGIATVQYKSLGFSHAVGFEGSEKACAVAASRNIESRRWLIGDGPCPANDGEFDVVIAADVIEHLVDTDQFVREVWRILKPGGRLIATTPNLAFWLSRLRLFLGRVPWSHPGASATVKMDGVVDLNHIRLSIRQEWEGLFRAHGFVVHDVRGWSILGAVGGNHARKLIDRWLTRTPTLAFGLLFLLQKPLTGSQKCQPVSASACAGRG
jgi:SAM-dependent methyltransferase